MPQMPMLDLRAPATKDSLTNWKAFMGIPQQGVAVPRSLREFGRQPADEAWVYRGMAVRANAVAGMPLRVQVKDSRAWVDVEESPIPEAVDLQYLLDDVNPGWEGTTLQAYTEAGAVIHGGSYWLKVRGGLGGRPQELHWLSGADVEAKMGRSLPETYTYQPQGQASAEDYRARDIIPHRDTVNLENPYKLLSPLSAARYEIATNRGASEWNAALLENWNIPPGAWVAEKDVEFDQTEKNLIKRALRQLRGPSNQGKTPVLPGGLKWQALSMNAKDAEWLASRKVSRMAICAVTGVPLVLAGDDEKAGVYASVRDAERVMWRVELIPTLDRRAARLDSWLVPDFDPSRRRIRVRYDYSGIEALRAAPAEDMQQWLGAVDRGLPINRWLARYGERPVEGGDEPRFKPEPTAGDARPAEYQTASETGRDRRPATTRAADVVRTLGRSLYRYEDVKAFLNTDDRGWLDALGPFEAADRDALAVGLKRRYSADQLLSGVAAEGFAGLTTEVTP